VEVDFGGGVRESHQRGDIHELPGHLGRITLGIGGPHPHQKHGHGLSGQKNETIDPYLTYLKSVAKWSKKAYDEDLEAYEVKPKAVEDLKMYENWDGFAYALGRHLMKAYDEVAMEDEEE